MRVRNDLSRSFFLPGSTRTYLSELQCGSFLIEATKEAERLIRDALSSTLPSALTKGLPQLVALPKPKYLRQGSSAYGLLNDPLRSSANYAEADTDLGVYQPLSTMKTCSDDPGIGADLYLNTVEAILTGLANRHGWEVKRKTCCIRVKVRDDAHVDVTCYVVPDEEFRQMAKALNFAAFDSARADVAERDLTWEDIPERPLLATDDGWTRSNAKAIHKEIEHAAELYGPPLKRIIRYVKGARDFNDDPKGLCSIAITLILIRELVSTPALARDDLGVLAAFGMVADGLLRPLPTPGDRDIDILANLSGDVKARLYSWLKDAQAQIRSAIYDLSRDQAHEKLRGMFGERFPSAADAPSESTETSSVARNLTSTGAALAPAGNVRSA